MFRLVASDLVSVLVTHWLLSSPLGFRRLPLAPVGPQLFSGFYSFLCASTGFGLHHCTTTLPSSSTAVRCDVTAGNFFLTRRLTQLVCCRVTEGKCLDFHSLFAECPQSSFIPANALYPVMSCGNDDSACCFSPLRPG